MIKLYSLETSLMQCVIPCKSFTSPKQLKITIQFSSQEMQILDNYSIRAHWI